MDYRLDKRIIEPYSPRRKGRLMQMTLIVGMRTRGGIVIAGDTEESVPGVYRSSAEKIRLIQNPGSGCLVVAGGSGDVGYIRMIGDFVEEKLATGGGTDTEVVEAIRESIREIWREHVRYEQGQVDVSMLLASYSSDKIPRFTVTSGASIRNGRKLEAVGVGDATFRALADAYLNEGFLSTLPGDAETLRIFTLYALYKAKQTVPGVGGGTRMVTLNYDGTIKWEKSWKVSAVQRFFSSFEVNIANSLSLSGLDAEKFVQAISRDGIRDIQELHKEIERIEADDTLV